MANHYADHYLEVFRIAQLTGEIMLKNGAETYRVEDTITRILRTTGFAQIEAFTTLTGITISLGDPSIMPITSVKRVQNRSNHLRKVEMANDISRKFVGGQLSTEEALRMLENINTHPFVYPRFVVVPVCAMACGCFCILFGGNIRDFLATILVGTLYGCFTILTDRLAAISFIKDLHKEDRNFYADVLLLLDYQNNPGHFKGKGGKVLCTKEYISYFTQKIGLSNIPMRYLPKGGTYEYADNMKYALNGIRNTISADLFANGQYLSVENINKLKLVSDDMVKLINKGFDDKFKSTLTDVANVDGLMIDRDYQVLSGDDLALVKALSNEYLYYEQERNQPVMEALAYEVVKIRQKAIYYDQYNRGPYLNKEGYESDTKIYIESYVMNQGNVWLEKGGGDNDFVFSIMSMIIPGKITTIMDILLFLLSLTKEQRAKDVLEDGDVHIIVRDWNENVERDSFYKRDGTYILTNVDGLHKNAQIDHMIYNPDIALKSIEDILTELVVDEVGNQTLEYVKNQIIKIINQAK